MATTRAGNLRERVGFYRPVSTDDGYGNVTSGYDILPDLTVSAAIVPKLGGESVLAGRLTGTNYVNITVRYSAAAVLVGTDWMVRDERSGQPYNIRSIIDPYQGTPGHHSFLEMLCETGVAIGLMATTGMIDFTLPDSSGLLALLEDV